MKEEIRIDRRRILKVGLAFALGAPLKGVEGASQKRSLINPEEGVTAPEDLMKEHGVLNRCLLIYEEAIRRLQSREEVTPEVFRHTTTLIRQFVHGYHERNEEKYIFPVFERAKRMVDLVAVLKTQHRAGRRVTAEILRLSQPNLFRERENQEHLIVACQSFIRMYRPHEAREDTVLFPALRSILTPKQVESLGERMEEDERRLLGEEGFERTVNEVAKIEKQLGIYDLKQFTAKI